MNFARFAQVLYRLGFLQRLRQSSGAPPLKTKGEPCVGGNQRLATESKRLTRNVWPAPSANGLYNPWTQHSASTYPASERCLPAKIEIRQPGPHNHSGPAGRSLSQVSVLPFRLSGHLALTTRRHSRSISDNYHRKRPTPLCVDGVRGIESATASQHCPGDTRQFVGERHYHYILVGTRQ